MKTLIIVRHAKSSWEYPVDDKDRPLKLRGIKDAHLVANYIQDKIKMPDVIYSSIANRALHTCAIYTRTLKYPYDKVHIKESMYDFGGSGLVATVKSCDDEVDTLMVFGHNHARGTADNAEIALSGSGDIHAYTLKAKSAKVSLAGSGDIRVHAIDYMKARVAGSGDITYKGKPAKLDTKVAGSGNISSK